MYNDRTSDKEPIFVYPKMSRFWKNLIIGFLLIFFGGLMSQCSESSLHSHEIFKFRLGGWALVAFGVLFFADFFVCLIRKLRHKPLCVIYDDRLEQYNLLKRRWDPIFFKHVSEFVLADYGSFEVIEPHLYEEVLKFIETDETDSIRQQTTIKSNVVADIEDIGILLNERLGKYQKTHPHVEGQAI